MAGIQGIALWKLFKLEKIIGKNWRFDWEELGKDFARW